MVTNWKENVIMYWDQYKISDHSRSPLQESYDVVERKSRMANGTLRRYVVAKKKNWQTSWENLPSHNDVLNRGTVDGGIGGKEMEEFYREHSNHPFVLTLRDGDGNIEEYTVILSEFSKEIVKRGAVDWYNISVEMEEV